ncbi:hypothetical protein HMPREF1557_00724 [Streptococcus sobrinus W1703]|uniref:Uncharacterized protein n=1 Tax=Streptococcus sobrinus W1703 TaxID=1227275 RepID=U2JCT7_9STRE|nr:hypothetical protein HMPREF1557_00724 [Streptococcus sobrinus W1703]
MKTLDKSNLGTHPELVLNRFSSFLKLPDKFSHFDLHYFLKMLL